MSKVRLRIALLPFAWASMALSACGHGDRPSSLVSFGGGGESGRGNGAGHGGTSGDGGAGNEAGSPGDEAGAAGEEILPAVPIAIFPEQLQVDVGCGSSPGEASLLIRNAGLLPLTITDATVSAGYSVKSELPLEIPAMAGATLQVTPPAPAATASVGERSSGTLSFVTNEPDTPTHEVQLNTTLYGGVFELEDGNGNELQGALPLTYLSSDTCPDRVKYRVRNTGNLAFTLFGPTFPSHLGGTSTGADGSSVPADGYLELEVSGNSASDGACSGSGDLTFTVQGSLCSGVPKLSVVWPARAQTTGCTCAATD